MSNIETALKNAGILDGSGKNISRIIGTARYAVKQTFARPVNLLTEKQIIWAYEKYCEDIDKAEAEGYGCPNL